MIDICPLRYKGSKVDGSQIHRDTAKNASKKKQKKKAKTPFKTENIVSIFCINT